MFNVSLSNIFTLYCIFIVSYVEKYYHHEYHDFKKKKIPNLLSNNNYDINLNILELF
jgi:hypothetical protein